MKIIECRIGVTQNNTSMELFQQSMAQNSSMVEKCNNST